MAMYLISCHKKGISSVQLATDIHVTQKTAWFILRKVRTLFAQEDVMLSGIVECDEMYLGGRETNKHEAKKTKDTQGGAKTKVPVSGMTMKWNTEDEDTVTISPFPMSNAAYLLGFPPFCRVAPGTAIPNAFHKSVRNPYTLLTPFHFSASVVKRDLVSSTSVRIFAVSDG